VIHRRLGHPVLLAGVYLLFLFILLFHGLVIWQNPAQRALGVFVGLLMLGVTINLIRQGGFARRLVLELREDQRQDGRSLFAFTAGGQPLTGDVWLGYGDSEQHVQASSGEIPAFASLRNATFNLPAATARELKVWAHQITPEESAQYLPALLNVRCGSEEQEFDLKQSGGQVVLPMTGEACRLEVTLPEVNSA
jgi:hypothetical protein